MLSRRYWEERPAFLSILTPRYGIMDDVRLVWGRKDGSFTTRQGAVEPMALSWFELEMSDGGSMARWWEPVDLFGGVRVARPVDILEMGHLVEQTIPPREPVWGVFRLALKVLRRADAERSYPLLAAFASGLLELLGYGIGELLGGGELGRFLAEEPWVVLDVCRGIFREVLGVEQWMC